MVQQASAVARELGISREEQDAWAAALARAGRGGAGRGPLRRRDRPRRRCRAPTRASAATRRSRSSPSLKPVFDPEGTTTAGNAPGVNDGASCVVVCSEEWAAERRHRAARADRRPRVRRRRVRVPRAHPGRGRREGARGAGPHDRRRGSRVEINEAFASVARNSTRMLGVDEEQRQRQRRCRRARSPDRRLRRAHRDDARPRAPALRRRARARGDLLGRRPGRRGPRRGLTPWRGASSPRSSRRSSSRPPAHALDCPNVPLEERLAAADAAFVGRVVTERPRGAEPGVVYRFARRPERQGPGGPRGRGHSAAAARRRRRTSRSCSTRRSACMANARRRPPHDRVVPPDRSGRPALGQRRGAGQRDQGRDRARRSSRLVLAYSIRRLRARREQLDAQ